MSEIAKSLTELDSIADELLSKSVKKSEDEPAPEDISSDEDNEANGDKASGKPDDESDNESDDKPSKKKKPDQSASGDGDEDDVQKSALATDSMTNNSANGDLQMNKSDCDEDEDCDEDDDEDDVKKSFLNNKELAKGMQNSEFYGALVSVMSDALSKSFNKLTDMQDTSNKSSDILAKSLMATIEMNKSLGQQVVKIKRDNKVMSRNITKSLEDIKESIAELGEMKDMLESMASQPQVRKSVGNISVMERNFQKSINGQGADMNLSKSEVLGILNDELFKGNPMVTAQDIIGYESGAPLRQELMGLIANKQRM